MISSLLSNFEFFGRRVILLSSGNFSLYTWQGQRAYLFNADEEGYKEFSRYISQTPTMPTYILVDSMHEEFHLDTIPKLSRADREAVIKRKKDRLFGTDVYFYSEVQSQHSKVKNKRAEEDILLTAIKDTGIGPIRDILMNYQVPLHGIIPLSQIMKLFLPSLEKISDHVLLASVQSSGLRQTFLHKGQLKMSRLTMLPRYNVQGYSLRMLTDADTMFKYLNSQRLLVGANFLDVCFFAGGELLQSLKQSYKSNNPMIRPYYIDIAQLADLKLGFKIKHPVPFSDSLFAHTLLKYCPPNIYAVAQELRFKVLRRTRYTLYILSVLLILGSSVYGVVNIFDTVVLNRGIKILVSNTRHYESNYQARNATLPKNELAIEDMEKIMEVLPHFKQHDHNRVEMLTFVGEVLLSFPSVQLKKIKWERGLGDKADGENNPSAEQVAGDEASEYYQTAWIWAKIEPFNGDYRSAIALINRFTQALQESTNQVTIVELPMDMSSEKTLRGDINTSMEAIAEFIIKATIRKTDEG